MGEGCRWLGVGQLRVLIGQFASWSMGKKSKFQLFLLSAQLVNLRLKIGLFLLQDVRLILQSVGQLSSSVPAFGGR